MQLYLAFYVFLGYFGLPSAFLSHFSNRILKNVNYNPRFNSKGLPGVDDTAFPNFNAITADLAIVYNKIKEWKELLPERSTEESEEILNNVIKGLSRFNESTVMQEIMNLNELLKIEKQKRLKLEADVTKLEAKVKDTEIANNLMDIFGLLKQFIIKLEVKTGNYSVDMKKASDKDIFDSLYPEPIDPILDTADEVIYKTRLLKLCPESKSIFSNLGLSALLPVIHKVHLKVRDRNNATHFLDNKHHKDLIYIDQKLTYFKNNVIPTITSLNELMEDKDDLIHLMDNLKHVHILACGKYSAAAATASSTVASTIST